MKKLLSLIFFLFSFVLSHAQSVNQPLYSDVYSFLSRMAQKGVIRFYDEIKPLTRKYILEKLEEVRDKAQRYRGTKVQGREITKLEMEELEFFLRDYNLEKVNSEQLTVNSEGLKHRLPGPAFSSQRSADGSAIKGRGNSAVRNLKSGTDSLHNSQFTIHNSQSSKKSYWFRDNLGRYRLFSYSSELFKVNLDPILGYEIGSKNGASYSHLWNGVRLYGYVSNWLGFSFDFRDNSVDGKYADKTASFIPETGWVVTRATKNHFEYEHTNTSIYADWSWGRVSIGKIPLVWGYGESGNIVHSTRAPSYPMIRLDLTLTPWLRFNYFHGWLSSDVVDSSAIYSTLRAGQNRIVLRNKYIASHTIIINPLEGLSVSLGESVIYSDKLEPLFLFPLMFFRSADHYLSCGKGGNNSGANSQFFLGVSSRNQVPNTHLYGTFFIDEVTIGDLFNPKKQRTQYAFQIGASVTDLPVDNLTFTTEFTKIYPFVYRHYIPTQTYANHNFVLGDWMEHNADRIYASLNYRFLRGLQATFWGEYIRKGGDGVVEDQYKRPQPPFLFGLKKYYTRWGITAKYEIVHDLFVRLRYNDFITSQELSEGKFTETRISEFYFAVYYGR
jgi:hypothetical protein